MIIRRIIAFLILPFFCSCIKENVRSTDLKPGDSIPQFSVVMNDGSLLSSDYLSAGVSCIVFFHTMCPDCQQELPVIQSIYNEYEPLGVRFACISREETEESIDAYWKNEGLTIPYSPQKDRVVYEMFAKTRVPRVYVSDSKGFIRYIYTDDPIATREQLSDNLDEMLGR